MYNTAKIVDAAKSFTPFERDCCITVALKISDDSCKMDEYEKSIFMQFYDQLPSQESEFFKSDVFKVIAQARTTPSAHIYAEVKKLREDAMDMITRPKMKAFKALARKKILN